MRRIASRLVFGVLVSLTSCADHRQGPPPAPPTVLTAPVTREDVALYVDSVGALDGYVNAEMRARVRGYLRSQDYADGSFVKAGQTLFTIEPTEFNAAVSSAKGNLERALALQNNTRLQLERAKGLFEGGSISPQEVDNATAAFADANGQVEAARAALATAQLNLSYTSVKSPIDGIAGIALIRVGNLVGQSDPTLLTTVSQVDPIRANFTMSEVDYIRYPDRLKRIEGRDLAWAQAQFPKLAAGGLAEQDDPGVQLILADDSIYPQKGVIINANRQVDPSTGTIQLQALFPNPNSLLKPGQYARVRVRRGTEGLAQLVVPERALISVQGQYSIGVVGTDSKVQLRHVELGPLTRGRRIVKDGVREGEQIVVEGTQKIKDGAQVAAKPAPPEMLDGGVEGGAADGGASK